MSKKLLSFNNKLNWENKSKFAGSSKPKSRLINTHILKANYPGMHYKYFITLIFFFGIHQAANANFVFNSNATAAYQAIFDLRFNDARKYIRDEKINNPQNGIPVLLENYIDYLFLLTSENKIEFEKFKNRKSGRIDAIKKNDKNSPYYLFAQAAS